MFEKLRRYDLQATYAVALALFAVVPFLGAVFLAVTRYDATLGKIVYGGSGRFLLAFAAAVLVSLIPAVFGFALGWNSAGQRRNDKSALSWAGFFLGGLVATFDLILLIAFYLLRLQL